MRAANGELAEVVLRGQGDHGWLGRIRRRAPRCADNRPGLGTFATATAVGWPSETTRSTRASSYALQIQHFMDPALHGLRSGALASRVLRGAHARLNSASLAGPRLQEPLSSPAWRALAVAKLRG